VVLPKAPPNPWNYTEPVHDSVGSYNKESGPSMIPLMGEYYLIHFNVCCFVTKTSASTNCLELFPVTVEGEIVEIIMSNTRALNNVSEMHPWHLHGY
jgi:hypothetical protein